MMRPQFAFGGGMMMPSTPSPNFNGPDRGSNSKLKEVTKIRKSFPETWLWTNKTTGYFALLV